MAFTKINAAGIGSTELVTLHSLEVLNNATVGGVLTYEDVTNVDSVGLITARSGIVVGSGITLSKDGDIFATGITTISGNVKVGTGITLSKDGDIFATGITTISGNVKVGTGITLSPDGDGFFTGVVTATTFKGDGSQLSNVTSTTINTNADNRVITGSGSANTLNGESNLTFDGTNLKVGNTFSAHAAADNLVVGSTSGSNGMTILTGSATGNIFFNNGSANNGVIQYVHSSDPDQMISNSDGQIEFDAGGSERLRIESDGDVRLSYGDAATNYGFIRGWDSSTGNMIIGADQSATGTSGSSLIFRTRGGERARILHSGGITFNGDTATANALDDYEEGSFDATCANSVTLHSGVNRCSYTKIGRVVTVRGQVRINNDNGTSDFVINNLPFTNADADGEDSSLSVGAVRLWDFNVTSDTVNVICLVVGQNTNLEFWVNKDNASSERLDADSNAYVAFTVSYFST